MPSHAKADPFRRVTHETQLELSHGSSYEGKLCTCVDVGYQAKYLVDRNNTLHANTLPPPPPCRRCDGWPWWNLSICGCCGIVYYWWFNHQLTFSSEDRRRYYGSFCWDCANKLGTGPSTGLHRAAPPQVVLPIQESFSDIAERLAALDF